MHGFEISDCFSCFVGTMSSELNAMDILLEQTTANLSKLLFERHPDIAHQIVTTAAPSPKCRYLQKCVSGSGKNERQEIWRKLGDQDKEELLQMRTLADGGLQLVVKSMAHETRKNRATISKKTTDQHAKTSSSSAASESPSHDTQTSESSSRKSPPRQRRRPARSIEMHAEGKPRKFQKIAPPASVPRAVVAREPVASKVDAANVEPPAFDPEAKGSPLFLNYDTKMLHKKSAENEPVPQTNNAERWSSQVMQRRGKQYAESVDISYFEKFLKKRKTSEGASIRDKLMDAVSHADGWYCFKIKGFTEAQCSKLSLGSITREADWQQAWHGFKIESLYATLYDGFLKESDDTALGHRMKNERPGVYAHEGSAAYRVHCYMRFVQWPPNTTYWRAMWELMVDRSDRVGPRSKTTQWITRARSVHLKALWVQGKKPQDMESGTEVCIKWRPKEEINPFKPIQGSHQDTEEENEVRIQKFTNSRKEWEDAKPQERNATKAQPAKTTRQKGASRSKTKSQPGSGAIEPIRGKQGENENVYPRAPRVRKKQVILRPGPGYYEPKQKREVDESDSSEPEVDDESDCSTSRSETSDASQEGNAAMIYPPKHAIQQLVRELRDVAHDWDKRTYTESQFLHYYGCREGRRQWTLAKWATEEAAWALNKLQYGKQCNTTFFALRSILYCWMRDTNGESASNAQVVSVIFRALYVPLRFRAEYLEDQNTCWTEWATTDLSGDMRRVKKYTKCFMAEWADLDVVQPHKKHSVLSYVTHKFTKSVPLMKSILRTGVRRSEWMNNVQTIAQEKRHNGDEMSE